MDNGLKTIQQKTTQYWYRDGIYELSFGVLCFVLALFLFGQATLPKNSRLYPILISGFVLIILGSSFLLARFTNAIKTRLTYPRTGYVSYQNKPSRNRWLRFLLVLGIMCLLILLAIKDLIAITMVPAIVGLVFAAAMLFFSLRTSLSRFALIGLIALLTGATLSLLGIGDTLGLSIFNGIMGLTFFLSGLITLRSYLKNTTPLKD